MRERRPSQTASFVALARALADAGFTTARGFSDPVAGRLLSPVWVAARRLAERGFRKAPPEVRARSFAQLDVLPLRVLAIDAELERAVTAGCRQLVILGAGLDTRAFRLPALADVAVFEVDHPATQGYKRRKSAALRPLARSLTFVPVDFEREPLAARLAAAGHRAAEPTVWIWEGVVMYLSDAALRATLAAVSAGSASGSVLAVHYHEPDGRRWSSGHRLLLAFWSEPQIGQRPTSAMHDEVRRAGFEVTSDTRPAQWAERFGASPPAGRTAGITHLLVATRA